MEESKRSHIGFAVNLEIIEPVATGRKPVGVPCRFRTARELAQYHTSPLAEQNAVTKLIDRMLEIEPSQKRIGGHFCRAQDVASAIDFGFSKPKQLLHASLGIAPDPSMDRLEHPVKNCNASMGWYRAHRTDMLART